MKIIRPYKIMKHQGGFSLLEISIAIIIIGLIATSIITGTALIRQTTLRSIINDFMNYENSYQLFVRRYDQMPGDMRTAYTYWGSDCADDALKCNGNGNNAIDFMPPDYEANKAWKHLSLAEMINTDIARLNDDADAVIGTHCPRSKMSNTGYTMLSFNLYSGSIITTAIVLGRQAAGMSPLNAALTPQDAFYIDQKMDDGRKDSDGNFIGAGTGKIITYPGFDMVYNIDQCVLNFDDIRNAIYNINYKNAACISFMIISDN